MRAFALAMMILAGVLPAGGGRPERKALEAQELRVELLEHSSAVWVGGYRSQMSLKQAFGGGKLPLDASDACEDTPMAAFINTGEPLLSWSLKATGPEAGCTQVAYRVRVASSPDLLRAGKADVWDSGKVISAAQSCRIRPDGNAPILKEATVYYWNVEIWSSATRSGRLCPPSSFVTAARFSSEISRYPLEKHDETLVPDSRGRVDFGRDAFSQFSLNFPKAGGDSLIVHLGEKAEDGVLCRKTGGTIRYANYRLGQDGALTLKPAIRKDTRNTTPGLNESGVSPILMPEYIGEVYPFRYMDLERPDGTPLGPDAVSSVTRHRVSWPFDRQASYFHCSDSVLNAVWELCRYTIEATSFCGTYVDGDRERIPYEADAIINQLSHYAVDAEYSLARHSVRHLIYNPTWPTEWILQSLIMAWNDYMYTGDCALIEECYDDLKAKTLADLREDSGLISTRRGKCTDDFFRSIHFKGRELRDIVDWPRGEDDAFVFSDFNAVVNAYHYKALRIMADIAGVLGRREDREHFSTLAQSSYEAFNSLLFDSATGLYTDGAGISHSSLHGNMFALCFGLVPEERRDKVVEFVKSRSMACSVYGSQFLLDALYDSNEGDYALSLMNSTSQRSWYNMIRIGSTITTEAWDPIFKPNLDWNHPWGAAPANVISRKLMGVEPLESGFSKVRIKPQVSNLNFAEILVPTIRGSIRVRFDKNAEAGGRSVLSVDIPHGISAEVWLPEADGTWKIVEVPAGIHEFSY